MGTGKVYVVHNEWIRDPETKEMPYKIGITTDTVEKRYYGLGLKMPGEFTCDFAYEFDETYTKIEKSLHTILNKLNNNGEWFNINEETLIGIKTICELAGGKLITEEIEVEIVKQTEDEINKNLKKIIDKWDSENEEKTSGVSAKGRSIRLQEANSGLHYSFIIKNSRDVQILLGCYTKDYPNMDKILNEFDNAKINEHFFKYRPPQNKKETTLGWKGEISTLIPFNDIDDVIKTMQELIKLTKEKIISGTKEE